MLDHGRCRLHQRNYRICRAHNSTHDSTCDWARPPDPATHFYNCWSNIPHTLRLRSSYIYLEEEKQHIHFKDEKETMVLLSIDGVECRYGSIKILENVNL